MSLDIKSRIQVQFLITEPEPTTGDAVNTGAGLFQLCNGDDQTVPRCGKSDEYTERLGEQAWLSLSPQVGMELFSGNEEPLTLFEGWHKPR